jgi:hypothetical protein
MAAARRLTAPLQVRGWDGWITHIRDYDQRMEIFLLLLLIAAALCFGLAAFGVSSRVNLLALGLLCWVLTALIPAAQHMSGT